MRYRKVGSTDLEISEVAFGTGDNAGLMVLGDHAQRREAVRRALDLGINYFDTSPDYGKGRSEVQLGEALRELGAKPIITTKVEIMPEHLGMIPLRVRESVEASLRRLQMDSVDVVMLHNPPCNARDPSIRVWTPLTVEDVLGEHGALGELRKLRDAGKVRYLGLACEAADPEPVKQLLDTGEFSLINVWYNLLNPSAGNAVPRGLQAGKDYGQIIDYAHAKGVGAAIIRPLAAGALTRQAQGVEGRHPLASSTAMSSSMDEYLGEVRKASAFNFLVRPDRGLSQAAYHFLLQHPGVTTVISGPSDVSQLEEVAAFSETPDLTADELRRIEEVWKSNFAVPA